MRVVCECGECDGFGHVDIDPEDYCGEELWPGDGGSGEGP